jgi:uncharacterized membrane protein
MEIPLNAKVECSDGSCGESVAAIVNPTTEEVTYLVVNDKHFPRPVPHLVPVELVEETSSDLVRLRCTAAELAEMEEFLETQYIETQQSMPLTSPSAYELPYVMPAETISIPVEVERIPPGELAVRRGMTVEATDGHIGRVGELVVDPETGHITHVVLQEGHLWDKKEITLPLSAIDFAQENAVYLKLDKAAVERLPAIQIRRSYGKKAAQVEFFARVFDRPDKAEEALEFVKDLNKRKTVKLVNAAVLIKDQDGETTLKELRDLDTKQGRLFGAITGGLVGLVGGPVGAVVGALAGAGAGGLAAKWIDVGFSDKFLQGLPEHLQPGSSALLVLVEHQWAAKLTDALADLEGVMFQETITDRLMEQLLEESEAE